MARRFLAFTDDAALRPMVPPTLGFAYMRALVARHLGEGAARLLAEPQAVPGEGRQQWLTDAAMSVTVMRLGEAPAESAAAARAALAEARDAARVAYERLIASVRASDRQEATLILRAFEVPDDRSYVWVVGAHPVLVGWGRVATNARVLDAADLAVTWRRALPKPQLPPERLQEAIVDPLPLPRLRRPWAALLWLLFAVLAGTVAWRLLDACSLGLPGRDWRLSLPGACQAPVATAANDLLDRNAALRDMLESTRLALATKPFCPAPPPPPPIPPRRMDAFEDRCRERQCETGLVQISLIWNSKADVDLYVDCPSGRRIYHGAKGPGICGDGKLDVDAQNGSKVSDPIENIRWQSPLPTGRYAIGVTAYRYDGVPRPVRYELVVKRGEEIASCSGQISTPEETRQVVLTFETNLPLQSNCQTTR